MFIHTFWFFKTLSLEHGHHLSSPRSSAGLQIAMILTVRHQEADMVPGDSIPLFSIPPSKHIPCLLSHRILCSWQFFFHIQGQFWDEMIFHLLLAWLPRMNYTLNGTPQVTQKRIAFLSPYVLEGVEKRRWLVRSREREAVSVDLSWRCLC